MKKEYEKPFAEKVSFETDVIMYSGSVDEELSYGDGFGEWDEP